MTVQPLTLLEHLGGAEAIKATIDTFPDRLLANPLLAPDFIGVDLRQQHAACSRRPASDSSGSS